MKRAARSLDDRPESPRVKMKKLGSQVLQRAAVTHQQRARVEDVAKA